MGKEEGGGGGGGRKRRLVLVSSPFQGHMTPVLQLATILHSRGFSIAIAHPDINPPDPSNHPEFAFVSLPAGISDVDAFAGFVPFIEALNGNCTPSFREYLSREAGKGGGGELAAVIHDNVMFFVEPVARELNVPTVVLRSSSAAYLVAYNAIPWLHAEGLFPVDDSKSQEIIPELHPLRFKDLPRIGSSPHDVVRMAELSSRLHPPSAIVWNTIERLEHPVLSTLRQHYKIPILPLGPLHKMAPATPSTSFFEEDSTCVSWLDRQKPKSVLYVSLGSLAMVDEKELAEMAWGLVNSGYPFLWVVRPGSVRGSGWTEVLPEGLATKLGEKGTIVKWAPQKEVLAHEAVGGFWTHCGWNSILESLSEGVPMICSSFIVDQPGNARYVSYEWKVGIQLESIERGEIERAVRRVLGDEDGRNELKERAMAAKGFISDSLAEGGSSYNALDELIEFIDSSSLSNS